MSRCKNLIEKFDVVNEASKPKLELDNKYAIEVEGKNGKYKVILTNGGSVKSVQNIAESIDEAVDVKTVIKALIDFKPSDDNAEQGKIVQLLRGLAFSDDPKSTQFMKKLTDLISDANFGELVK